MVAAILKFPSLGTHTPKLPLFSTHLSDDMLGRRKLSVVWRKFLCLAQQACVTLVPDRRMSLIKLKYHSL